MRVLRGGIGWILVSVVVSCAGTPSATPEPRVAEADVDGATVAYEVSGRGEPAIVLVHGWACDRSVWWKLEPHLRLSHRVISIDLPGHGESAEPSGEYSMSSFAHSIAAALDREGIDRAVLVGHSNGVPTVRQFYREYPDRVMKLVLIDGALRSTVPPEMADRVIAQFESTNYQDVVGGFVASMPAPNLELEDRERLIRMAKAQRQSAVVGGFRASVDPSIWAQDPIEVPVLMINAPQPAWSEEYLEFCRGLVPDLEYEALDGAGHFLMVERPKWTADRIERFVIGDTTH